MGPVNRLCLILVVGIALVLALLEVRAKMPRECRNNDCLAGIF